MAAGLLALGIQPEQRVAIASATRVEWLYADLAIMCAGGATTTVYPSTARGRRRLHPRRQRHPHRLRRGRRPGRQAACAARPPARPDPRGHLRRAGGRGVGAEPGRPGGPGRQAPRRAPDLGRRGRRRRRARAPGDADLHVGDHRPAQGRGAAAPVLDLHRRRRRGHRDPAPRTTCSTCGCRCRTRSARCSRPCSCRSVSPRRSTAGSTGSSTTSPCVRPTFMAGPPRIFEKVYAKVVQTAQEEGGIKRTALRLGVRRRQPGLAGPGTRAGARARWLQAQHALADRLVLSQGPCPARRTDPVLRLGQRRAVAGHRRLVPRRRAGR